MKKGVDVGRGAVILTASQTDYPSGEKTMKNENLKLKWNEGKHSRHFVMNPDSFSIWIDVEDVALQIINGTDYIQVYAFPKKNVEDAAVADMKVNKRHIKLWGK